jgi:hypothetical protein
MNQFGEPELLDDLRDHWNSPRHVEERKALILMMQALAVAKGVRVSMLSGGAGRAAGCWQQAKRS